jgi:hypothetical protein
MGGVGKKLVTKNLDVRNIFVGSHADVLKTLQNGELKTSLATIK